MALCWCPALEYCQTVRSPPQFTPQHGREVAISSVDEVPGRPISDLIYFPLPQGSEAIVLRHPGDHFIVVLALLVRVCQLPLFGATVVLVEFPALQEPHRSPGPGG